MSIAVVRSPLQELCATLRDSGTGRTVAAIAGFNVVLIRALGLGGVIFARTVVRVSQALVSLSAIVTL